MGKLKIRPSSTSVDSTLDGCQVEPTWWRQKDPRKELSRAAGEPTSGLGHWPMSVIGTCCPFGSKARIEYQASRPIRVIEQQTLRTALPETTGVTQN